MKVELVWVGLREIDRALIEKEVDSSHIVIDIDNVPSKETRSFPQRFQSQ
jgi:hypothetical protein